MFLLAFYNLDPFIQSDLFVFSNDFLSLIFSPHFMSPIKVIYLFIYPFVRSFLSAFLVSSVGSSVPRKQAAVKEDLVEEREEVGNKDEHG